ncbi:MAG: hypothetical protein U0W40_19735 [Acidimicrobiia bacterium]|jgi:hypothetical protein
MRRICAVILAVVLGALVGLIGAAPAAADASVPTVLLLRGQELVAPGSEVRAGAELTVAVSGFAPDVRVSFVVGTTPLQQTIVTSASGSGSVAVTIPRQLGSSVYVLAASGGLTSASFVFYVYNPPAATRPTPTPVPTRAPEASPTPVPTEPAATVAAVPGTGASGGDDLATTGASLVPLGLAAGSALAVGLVLVVAGRRRPRGRHSIDRAHDQGLQGA